MFRLGDLEIEYTAKSRRKKSDHTGRWLPPGDATWDPNPWLQYFLVACYLIIVLIVLAGFLRLNARGAGLSSSAAENQALVSVRFPSSRFSISGPLEGDRNALSPAAHPAGGFDVHLTRRFPISAGGFDDQLANDGRDICAPHGSNGRQTARRLGWVSAASSSQRGG
jgi:hypothetical protein